MTQHSLKILLLCNRPVTNADASTITDHLDSFPTYSKHEIFSLSFLRNLPSRLDLSRFDVVVVHYTLALGYMREHYISEVTKNRIKSFRGLKVAFIQDEYRNVDSVHDFLAQVDMHALFTCVPEAEIEKVYPRKKLPNVKKINTLTGYVPKNLLKLDPPKLKNRQIDVGYRTRKPPFWLGDLGQEKWTIADKFRDAANDFGLKLDLSYQETDRLYGQRWLAFVKNCRCMLGVESGASVFDFSGELQRSVEKFVTQYPDATFEEIKARFLTPYENLIKLNQISPRCFESAALRTVMVLYVGDYSGILKPWQHFVPLEKDFSNFREVLNFINNDQDMQSMADRTFEEIASNSLYSYEHFIQQFDDVIRNEFTRRGFVKCHAPYSYTGFRLATFTSPGYFFKRFISITLQRFFLSTFIRRWLYRLWGNMPPESRSIARPLLRWIGR